MPPESSQIDGQSATSRRQGDAAPFNTCKNHYNTSFNGLVCPLIGRKILRITPLKSYIALGVTRSFRFEAIDREALVSLCGKGAGSAQHRHSIHSTSSLLRQWRQQSGRVVAVLSHQSTEFDQRSTSTVRSNKQS